MQKETVVRSYVRSYRQEPSEVPEQSNAIGYVVGGSVLLSLAVCYLSITVLVVLSLGALYGVRNLYLQYKASTVSEAVTEAPNAPELKVKRHYQSRLKVHDYNTGKTVRV